jgi:hypothetical protein
MSLNDWMSRLKDGCKLNQVVLPATHDSGMSFQSYAGSVQNLLNPLALLAKGVTGVVATIDDLRPSTHRERLNVQHDNFTTQLVNVAGQLQCGARQFDLRITRHNGTHRAYHGAYLGKLAGLRRYGEKWADICTGIAQFMAANPSEVLILKMDKQEVHTFGWTRSTMQMLLDALSAAKYTNALPRMLDKWIDQATIGDLRGRILVCGVPATLLEWKPMVAGSPILLCNWQKNETGQHPDDASSLTARISPNVPAAFPTYLLLGGAKPKGIKAENKGDRGYNDRDNVLDKQVAMRKQFEKISRIGKAGMRGIWFNTFSWMRDIKTYSDEIWSAENKSRREALWLDGANRQNVASVDFLTPEIGEYVVGKNPETNWR